MRGSALGFLNRRYGRRADACCKVPSEAGRGCTEIWGVFVPGQDRSFPDAGADSFPSLFDELTSRDQHYEPSQRKLIPCNVGLVPYVIKDF